MFTVCSPSPMLTNFGLGRGDAKLSTASTASNASTCGGGLRRTVSTLQAKPCLLSHQKIDRCVVEAKQVEMEFASLTGKAFSLRIRAPNSERSERMEFPGYGTTRHFSPRGDGCGHGLWHFLIEPKDGSAPIAESLYLDGVGSLFFSVDDSLCIRLSHQEFLRLPSASRCCSRAQN